jgi:hypothetical protein
MVDRPQPVDPQWLEDVKLVYGDYELVPMTAGGDRGIVCQMYVAQESVPYLKQFESPKTAAIQQVLSPLLEEKPNPMFKVLWDPELRVAKLLQSGRPDGRMIKTQDPAVVHPPQDETAQ